MASFFLASHPRVVREAIERHRRGFDEDPVGYFYANVGPCESAVRAAAAEYLGVRDHEIALTDSTTMGLGLLFGGLKLRADHELLTTTHDHYSMHTALAHCADRDGARIRKVSLYDRATEATEEGMASAIARAITPKTRVVAVTWVHSSTGVKIPLARIATAVARANQGRSETDRVLLCVDGVHGLGVDSTELPALGCDFFSAGCHKWIFGPRGTGILWGSERAWASARPVIPCFTREAFDRWEAHDAPASPSGPYHSPGGFHSFEHRWALDAAFRFHLQLGKAAIAARIAALAARLRDGLAACPNVTLQTPRSPAVTAGIVCFEVKGYQPKAVVEALAKRNIIASTTPYATTYARLSTSLFNTKAEVDTAVGAVSAL
jgi:selenocysteine lyase/cysteine desulfurase